MSWLALIWPMSGLPLFLTLRFIRAGTYSWTRGEFVFTLLTSLLLGPVSLIMFAVIVFILVCELLDGRFNSFNLPQRWMDWWRKPGW